MSRVVAVIPARMGSSRFPGKPLARLLGKPMLEYVYAGTRACPLVDEVMVATCDGVIAEAAAAFGARAVLTAASHERATDRVAEAVAGEPAEVVVMVQGDEPMVQPGMVAAVVDALRGDASVGCVNLAAEIGSDEELRDPNTIKVVTTATGDALYFSRAPIPWDARRHPDRGGWLKQVCVIGFRRETLRAFTRLAPGRLEARESIDMLRFLEHGLPVRIVETAARTQAVDTVDDLARVSALISASEVRP
jgi:3-deoxy-manno-octulosonate cytidylyltransferase (CMP-KDO synthetase)